MKLVVCFGREYHFLFVDKHSRKGILRGLVICFFARMLSNLLQPGNLSVEGDWRARANQPPVRTTGRPANKTPNSESPLSCKKALGPP